VHGGRGGEAYRRKGFGVGTTRGRPVVYTTAPPDSKVGKQIGFRELIYLKNETPLINLISWNATAYLLHYIILHKKFLKSI